MGLELVEEGYSLVDLDERWQTIREELRGDAGHASVAYQKHSAHRLLEQLYNELMDQCHKRIMGR